MAKRDAAEKMFFILNDLLSRVSVGFATYCPAAPEVEVLLHLVPFVRALSRVGLRHKAELAEEWGIELARKEEN